jgi:hypothetical protein
VGIQTGGEQETNRRATLAGELRLRLSESRRVGYLAQQAPAPRAGRVCIDLSLDEESRNVSAESPGSARAGSRMNWLAALSRVGPGFCGGGAGKPGGHPHTGLGCSRSAPTFAVRNEECWCRSSAVAPPTSLS